ncbi:MAG: hypothetical protein HW406_994 [Candidatus Brocadiaceae bacterium]|jgi:hypothetical protein|nr:hypothetical protein [Candidatus Brocadiaceae bacterium]
MEQIKEINLLIDITMSSPYNARVISCIAVLTQITNFLLLMFQKDEYIFMKIGKEIWKIYIANVYTFALEF